MYKYSAKVEVVDAVDVCTNFIFQVVLKESMPFKINDCYFVIKKNHDYNFKESDSLNVAYYSQRKNLSEAKEKIKRAIELFVYMTDIPFDVNSAVIESTENDVPVIDMQLSQRKMKQISEINQRYSRIRAKKELLQNVLQMYAVATKENYLLNENKEDAFFAFFKIIEIIVKDDFSIEKVNIDKGTTYTRRYVEQILTNAYGVATQENRLEDLCGNVSGALFEMVFENIYHKIMWFLKRHNIAGDKDIISNMVSLRNDIAHGEAVCMDKYMQEYQYVINLANKVITAKFFGASMKIESRYIII